MKKKILSLTVTVGLVLSMASCGDNAETPATTTMSSEIKTVDYEDFSGFTGKMLVKSDGAYYLADISDPDVLINPFEIAE